MVSHVTNPATRSLGDSPLFRVARSDAPLRPSVIDSADASTNAGNRFDVVGGAVLYLASTPAGCYAETLARFRPTAAMRAVLNGDEEWATSFVVCGGVPADWRTRRVKVQITAPGGLPFLDVEHPQSLEFLTEELAGLVASFGISQLDISDVRSGNRALTRAIASYAFHAHDEDGPLYSGIRYLSRLGEHECWALFEGTPMTEVNRETIDLADPALVAVAADFGLRIF